MRRSTTIRDRHRAIIRRGEPACHICGGAIDFTLPHTEPRSFVVDHVIPLARGGEDKISNKAAAHRQCNRAKGDKPTARLIVKRSGSVNL